MLSTVNVVVRKAPGQEPAVLGLRAAWAMLSNGGMDVRLLCMGDGVFNLLGLPGYAGGMLRRFMFEGGVVRALGSSLEERGLPAEALMAGVEVIDAEEAAEMVQDAEATTAY